ncbi:MAG: hypothetical protein PWR07_1325 [Bacillota bacterium]|nr:hypothetical protein [Bacillota bacterium]
MSKSLEALPLTCGRYHQQAENGNRRLFSLPGRRLGIPYLGHSCRWPRSNVSLTAVSVDPACAGFVRWHNFGVANTQSLPSIQSRSMVTAGCHSQVKRKPYAGRMSRGRPPGGNMTDLPLNSGLDHLYPPIEIQPQTRASVRLRECAVGRTAPCGRPRA